jgi:hypothetical protein
MRSLPLRQGTRCGVLLAVELLAAALRHGSPSNLKEIVFR